MSHSHPEYSDQTRVTDRVRDKYGLFDGLTPVKGFNEPEFLGRIVNLMITSDGCLWWKPDNHCVMLITEEMSGLRNVHVIYVRCTHGGGFQWTLWQWDEDQTKLFESAVEDVKKYFKEAEGMQGRDLIVEKAWTVLSAERFAKDDFWMMKLEKGETPPMVPNS